MSVKIVFKAIVMLSCAVLFSGCLSQLKTREDLRGQTPTTPTASPETQAGEESVPEPLPAYEQQEKNEQIRILYGRVEEAENQVRELRESMIELANSRQQEKEESQAKLQAYEEAIRNLEAQIQSLKSSPSSKSSKGEKKTTKENGESDANANLREDFYRGEDFFRQKKWKDAIVSYQKYRDAYPKGKFYPEATYNMGLCFIQLGLKDESKSFFEEVKVKFPKSPLAKKADKQLKSL